MPSSNPRYADYQGRVNTRRWLRSQGRPCWICVAFGKSGTIDYSLPALHPFSFEVDELVPVSKGGSPTSRSNVDATHRCCNEWRGNRSVAEVLELARKSKASSADSAMWAPESKGRPPIVEPVRGVTSALSD